LESTDPYSARDFESTDSCYQEILNQQIHV
jgi:hypothetical protein